MERFPQMDVELEGPEWAPGRLKGLIMLYWTVIFFNVAIVAAAFGFGGIASASAGIAQILFFIFAVLFVVTLVMRLLPRRG